MSLRGATIWWRRGNLQVKHSPIYPAFVRTLTFPQGIATALKGLAMTEFSEVFMYLNIGSDMMLRQRSVVGIFDLDNTSTSKRTRQFLEKAEQEGMVVPCDDLPKSFVLTQEYGMTRIYLTSLAASTLEKRMK
jgi:hypothetical protein